MQLRARASAPYLLLKEGLKGLEVDFEGLFEVGDGEARELVLVAEGGVFALWAGVREHPGMHSGDAAGLDVDAGEARQVGAFDDLGAEGTNGHGGLVGCLLDRLRSWVGRWAGQRGGERKGVRLFYAWGWYGRRAGICPFECEFQE